MLGLSEHDEAPATSDETVAAMLNRARRRFVPIRSAFLHTGRGATAQPGPLATLVKAGDHRGLLAYLLVHAAASAAPWYVTHSPGVWVRALRLGTDPSAPSARAAVSRLWARLERRGLITRLRVGRTTTVVLLREDGSGQTYTHPVTTPGETYFKLPHAFWLHGYDQHLSLPGLAMLLIACDLAPGFSLPYDKVATWYGISGDTAQRGLAELRAADVLVRWFQRKKRPLADAGWTVDFRYRLVGPLAKDTARTPDGDGAGP
ncbi:helix-turn-helix transcriptional regulator [Actinophytocola xanthii]|uniref:Uncharacterized protein n=1 Tax=Actinophytocola xanthii TaxID=1912961 RepID=A0A1Q8C2J2_9PSEU|nr:hypothetical protein [Actinophytocola xanthii]OLF08564.1 hypothetical protein BU204_34290 [Actinophytocola xanthii]